MVNHSTLLTMTMTYRQLQSDVVYKNQSFSRGGKEDQSLYDKVRVNKIYSWGQLKGQCHEIFDLHFFHDSNPPRPLINRLNYFRILFRFRRDLRIFKKLRSVHHPAESDSAVCNKIEIFASLWLVLKGQ